MTDQENSALTVQNEVAAKPEEKTAKAAKSKNVLDGPTHLYKHYDRKKKLLYVGVSLSALQRLLQHRKSAEWFDQIHMIIVKKYATRKGALAAERKLVAEMNPPFNRQKRPWNIRDHIFNTFGSYELWLEYTQDLDRGVPTEVAVSRIAQRKADFMRGLTHHPVA